MLQALSVLMPHLMKDIRAAQDEAVGIGKFLFRPQVRPQCHYSHTHDIGTLTYARCAREHSFSHAINVWCTLTHMHPLGVYSETGPQSFPASPVPSGVPQGIALISVSWL